MESQTSDKETGRAIFALYARAVAAFQSGEALLPLAKEKARTALALLDALPRPPHQSAAPPASPQGEAFVRQYPLV